MMRKWFHLRYRVGFAHPQCIPCTAIVSKSPMTPALNCHICPRPGPAGSHLEANGTISSTPQMVPFAHRYNPRKAPRSRPRAIASCFAQSAGPRILQPWRLVEASSEDEEAQPGGLGPTEEECTGCGQTGSRRAGHGRGAENARGANGTICSYDTFCGRCVITVNTTICASGTMHFYRGICGKTFICANTVKRPCGRLLSKYHHWHPAQADRRPSQIPPFAPLSTTVPRRRPFEEMPP